MERRGRQEVERGPVSDYVAENVAALRRARGLSQQELSARLTELGRPMLPSALSKIEGRDRGVDVDDLIALAVALGVNPSRLLLPGNAGDDEALLTSTLAVPGWAAWQWADASAPLPTRSDAEGYYNSEEEHEDFQLHSRPAEIRRELRHPLMLATNRLVFSVRRVIRHAAETSNPELLSTSLSFARRRLQAVAGELETIEEEVSTRGQR